MNAPVVVPSILSADLGRLREELMSLKRAGCRWVSVDVMDGHFVPNLSFGPDHVRLAKAAGMTVDAHLMVDNPERAAPWFAEAGADNVTVHYEASGGQAAKLLRFLRGRGVKAGLAVKPATAVEPLLDLVPEMDLALVMTVEPGFGGAAFLPDMLPKVSALREAVGRANSRCWVQVDGGIHSQTVAAAVSAGADSLVAGSAVFGAEDPAASWSELSEAARRAARAGKI